MRTTAVTAVFGLLLVATFALGGKKEIEFFPSVPPTTMPRVAEGPTDPALKQLINDLGSDDWRTREKAGRELEALAEKALPHMRKALLETENPEVRQRLTVLVRKMDRDRLVEPKRITLSAKDRTPRQVFEEIAKQTGYRIDFGGNDGVTEAKVSFEFNKTPFWQALDAVANAGGYSVNMNDYEDSLIRVYRQDSISPYVAYSGPFRVLATSIYSNRSVQLANVSKHGNNQRMNESMSLSFQIQSEPKNPMLGIMYPELTEAKDEFGGSLLLPRERNNYYRSDYYSGNYRGHNTGMSVNLVRSDRAATTIKSLKGRVGIVLLAGTVPDIVVTDPLKAKKHSITGRSLEMEFDNLTEDANQKGTYLVSFVAKRLGQRDPNRGDDYNWSNTVWQRLELADENGNRYYCYGPQTHNNNGQGTVQLTVMFGPNDRRTGQPGPNKLGPPKKFVLTEWITTTHELKFEFKDIPLP